MAWKTAGSPIVVSLLTQEHPPAQGGTPGRAQLPYDKAKGLRLRRIPQGNEG
jgi:hypothetical protein